MVWIFAYRSAVRSLKPLYRSLVFFSSFRVDSLMGACWHSHLRRNPAVPNHMLRASRLLSSSSKLLSASLWDSSSLLWLCTPSKVDVAVLAFSVYRCCLLSISDHFQSSRPICRHPHPVLLLLRILIRIINILHGIRLDDVIGIVLHTIANLNKCTPYIIESELKTFPVFQSSTYFLNGSSALSELFGGSVVDLK